MLETCLVPALVLLLAHAALPAVVLPRPPSSPNYIPVEYTAPLPSNFNSFKSYADKILYQRTNVEKPDTQQNFRLVEIELRDAENVESLDLRRLVQAVLEKQEQPGTPDAVDVPGAQNAQNAQNAPDTPDAPDATNARRLDVTRDEFEEPRYNLTYARPEIVPQSIVGVREVGLRPRQQLYESATLDNTNGNHQYLLSSLEPNKNLDDEKLYYLKTGKPKVHINFRGRSGNFRQDTATGVDSRFTLRLEPSTFLRATQPYHMEKKVKSSKLPPKKYDSRVHGPSAGGSTSTTENAMVTSSELPKQIPAPPSKIPMPVPMVQTTPVQRHAARRTDILPGYPFAEA